jgi:hypothetical protein
MSYSEMFIGCSYTWNDQVFVFTGLDCCNAGFGNFRDASGNHWKLKISMVKGA